MRPTRAAEIALALLAAFTSAGQQAFAQDFEKLLMPGPLIEGHAKAEDECGNCHRAFRRQAQRRLCLPCHDPIAEDVSKGQGFHGLSNARSLECRLCHTDHIGRDADIVGLDPDTFDHSLTDFPLLGRHQAAHCGGCHEPGALHRAAKPACVDCHRDDDVHDATLGSTCDDCHNPSAWKAAQFDHGRTAFPLIGKHTQVPCASCHPGERYRKEPTDCQACHAFDDVHRGDFGPRCETCHTSGGWDRVTFDHARDTAFALRGSHASLTCDRCHRQGPYSQKLPTDCFSCHESDDEHKGRFGAQCERCHHVVAWKNDEFNHDQTRFPLRGMHQEVSCVACHRGVLEEEQLGTTCESCHLDVHQKQLGDSCDPCHREEGWRKDVFFDHGITRFPLLGLHAVAPCEECHSSARFREAPSSCEECHHEDDFHERALGPACELCHNPNGWKFWRFEHDTQTRFELDGAHEELACRSCHHEAVEDRASISQKCVSCHSRNDIHMGGYGHDCGRCHATSDWREVTLIR